MTRAGILCGGGLAFMALAAACVIHQAGRPSPAQSAPGVDLATAVTLNSPIHAPAVLPPMLRAEFDGARLVLTGRVPDAALRDTIVLNAQRLYGASQVTNRLSIVPGTDTAWLSGAFPPDLRETRRSVALLQDGRLLVSGDTDTDEAHTRIATALRAAAAPGWTLDLRLNGGDVEPGDGAAPPRPAPQRTHQTAVTRP